MTRAFPSGRSRHRSDDLALFRRPQSHFRAPRSAPFRCTFWLVKSRFWLTRWRPPMTVADQGLPPRVARVWHDIQHGWRSSGPVGAWRSTTGGGGALSPTQPPFASRRLNVSEGADEQLTTKAAKDQDQAANDHNRPDRDGSHQASHDGENDADDTGRLVGRPRKHGSHECVSDIGQRRPACRIVRFFLDLLFIVDPYRSAHNFAGPVRQIDLDTVDLVSGGVIEVGTGESERRRGSPNVFRGRRRQEISNRRQSACVQLATQTQELGGIDVLWRVSSHPLERLLRRPLIASHLAVIPTASVVKSSRRCRLKRLKGSTLVTLESVFEDRGVRAPYRLGGRLLRATTHVLDVLARA